MRLPRTRYSPVTCLLLALLAASSLYVEAEPPTARQRLQQALQLPESLGAASYTVEGVAREALIYAPASAKSSPTPVVFVFHGHGGNARQAARSFGIYHEWPEAISVYMQGLPTKGQLTDPEGKKNGWQGREGLEGNRDLKFFDAVLAKLKTDYKVDSKRIYSTGHSNGGGFTYMLWAERGDVFAAMAPSAAAAPFSMPKLKPKPAMHLAGETDPLVKYEWQVKTMEAVRKLNGCESQGKAWNEVGTAYPSLTGTPFVSLIHPGGHQFLQDAPPLIVKFFKEHPASSTTSSVDTVKK
ncbi:polyhydroxybutyrate depolymerase [Roseimicrobium gellanilyticum]|uniref:Polyhydroxybutyrate depolymerase n=1 Tax=Roseimicrobium gellanilyticum TaxID=748857 RepID=A0A366HS38_9BACT|nr:prolyl oligopeptidase family serine peptidase [Roseimicrobium gellanilyticum]RBP46316.1 polyhydroxybutyrate depolymerase [Roseimicrobium gellanilyticum]